MDNSPKVLIMMGSDSDLPVMQEAADILGIDQATLWRRRKQYGI